MNREQERLIVGDEIERLLRKEWWLNHGHDYIALYGDDGEMSCGQCPADFKREPLDALYDRVMVARAARAKAAYEAMPAALPGTGIRTTE